MTVQLLMSTGNGFFHCNSGLQAMEIIIKLMLLMNCSTIKLNPQGSQSYCPATAAASSSSFVRNLVEGWNSVSKQLSVASGSKDLNENWVAAASTVLSMKVDLGM
ncbi:hypothetical protein F3Y22_tig00005352pilonHSYRG00013 [Hibiscus syriacus]|uniref:Uncharacterized protein n=1 Tax=Hibiscus syriacus TaxID=106335 RepID=A0A6A3CGY3_HIBSY|nr:hypothetical protein F3Y22_tig00005352pilonHSYRG00013 [Hibiscus syriacus]